MTPSSPLAFRRASIINYVLSHSEQVSALVSLQQDGKLVIINKYTTPMLLTQGQQFLTLSCAKTHWLSIQTCLPAKYRH